VILALTADPIVVRGLRRVAAAVGVEFLTTADRAARAVEDPAVVVLDLEQPGAVDEVQRQRAGHGDALLVGHLATPRPDVWQAAERAGCDLVANRGAVARQVRRRLEAEGGPRRRHFPLFEAAELAGRLGFVARVDDTPVGPVAVYQVDGAIFAVGDSCPHAGAAVCEGEVEGAVVTCPRHGSQFDVRTGERLRGPADSALPAFEVVEESGRVQLILGS
jgi:nitrite reductase/ring-hydroxylating ferredoxin subunit